MAMVRQAHHDKEVENAVRVLKRGGVVLFPTETAYGIGCDATNAAAVRKIYRIKRRERGKPLPLIAADLRQVKKFFRIGGAAVSLARKYWPGPLTIVLPARDRRLPRAVGRTIGVRVSSHRIPRLLASRIGRPIVATSANRSGRPTCYSVACVRRQLGDAPIDAVLDAGAVPRRKPSTVVRIVRGRVLVLRRGPVEIGSSV